MAIDLIGTCVELPAELVERFNRNSREVGAERFRTYLTAPEFKQISESLQYPSTRKDGMIILDDPCVTYHIGVYDGKEVFSIMHSAIHHIYNRSALEKHK